MHRLRNLMRASRTVGLFEWPRRVVLCEVSARDGLQNEKEMVPTEAKIKYLQMLTEAGFSVIEATSFVSPKRVPQLADAAQVLAGLERRQGVMYPVLTPNMKGLENAMASGAKEIALFTAASEEFCRRNLNMTIKESLSQFESMAKVALNANMAIRGYVSCAMGCPFSGHVDPSTVATVTKELIGLGCYEVSIGDTIGVGTAASVQRVFKECMKTVPVKQLAAHMHDTYGQGLSNVLTSLQMGIETVDASVGGLGGCPFAPGATGNVATEDVMYLLDGLGIPHGIDWHAIFEANCFITEAAKTRNMSRAATAMIRREWLKDTATNRACKR